MALIAWQEWFPDTKHTKAKKKKDKQERKQILSWCSIRNRDAHFLFDIWGKNGSGHCAVKRGHAFFSRCRYWTRTFFHPQSAYKALLSVRSNVRQKGLSENTYTQIVELSKDIYVSGFSNKKLRSSVSSNMAAFPSPAGQSSHLFRCGQVYL